MKNLFCQKIFYEVINWLDAELSQLSGVAAILRFPLPDIDELSGDEDEVENKESDKDDDPPADEVKSKIADDAEFSDG